MENTSSIRHQEGLVDQTDRLGDLVVHGIHQVVDSLNVFRIAFESFQRRSFDHAGIIAIKLVSVQKFANFHFHQFQHFFIVDEVHFVHEHDNTRNAYLASQQDVLAGLRHRAVGSGNDENSAIHLSGARNHVLHVVGVAGAIYVRIVTFLRLIFHVRGIDRNTTLFFFRSSVDRVVIALFSKAGLRQNHRDRSSQRRLTVVNVTDGADVYVRFCPFKFSLSHRIEFWI